MVTFNLLDIGLPVISYRIKVLLMSYFYDFLLDEARYSLLSQAQASQPRQRALLHK